MNNVDALRKETCEDDTVVSVECTMPTHLEVALGANEYYFPISSASMRVIDDGPRHPAATSSRLPAALYTYMHRSELWHARQCSQGKRALLLSSTNLASDRYI